jgi:hypothetical protein
MARKAQKIPVLTPSRAETRSRQTASTANDYKYLARPVFSSATTVSVPAPCWGFRGRQRAVRAGAVLDLSEPLPAVAGRANLVCGTYSLSRS